jgi:hypothetical protein
MPIQIVTMLTKADDYPIHQTPEPIALAGTDRNFYDRYFFNGQAPDGSAMVAAAMGIYPHLNIIDAAVSVTDGATQRSLFASRILGHERLDTRVGPVTVTVEEPLHRLRVTIAENATGIAGDIVFTGRAAPIEEPRFIRRTGSRTLMDVTRMTQGGDWSGWISAAGTCHDLAGWRGVRDRSWGVRPVGSADSQPVVPPELPQFFWLWTPIAFDDWLLFFHTNDDSHGRAWNRAAVLVSTRDGSMQHLIDPVMRIQWLPGSRHARSARLAARLPDGSAVTVDFSFGANFLMRGLGYGHPTSGHGMFQGADVGLGEVFDLAEADPALPTNAHVQAQVTAALRIGDEVHAGRGIFEQLCIGPHAPSGFAGLFDLAG